MILISNITLKDAYYNCRADLDDVANYVLPEKAVALREAIEKMDVAGINEIIDASLRQYLGEDYLRAGYEKFMAKFGIKKDFSAEPDTQIAAYVADNYSFFDEKLNEFGFSK